MKKSLEESEWLLSFSFIFILISLFLAARFHEHRKNSQIQSLAAPIELPVEVAISGEVARPGIFSVLPGARLGDLVKKSRPKPFADLQGIDLDRPVSGACELVIPRLSEIAIRVEGAVLEPVELRLPPGSRLCDLKLKIQCDPDADPQFLKRRRQLLNGDVVCIPRKKGDFSSGQEKNTERGNNGLKENRDLLYDLEPVLKTSF